MSSAINWVTTSTTYGQFLLTPCFVIEQTPKPYSLKLSLLFCSISTVPYQQNRCSGPLASMALLVLWVFELETFFTESSRVQIQNLLLVPSVVFFSFSSIRPQRFPFFQPRDYFFIKVAKERQTISQPLFFIIIYFLSIFGLEKITDFLPDFMKVSE